MVEKILSLKHRYSYESLVKKYKTSEIQYLKSSCVGDLSIALIFPNLYSLGMSNLGYMTVHRILSEMPGIAVERFFPALESDSPLAAPYYSFESNRPLGDFQILMFSFSFEGDFDKIPGIFSALGFPVIAKERNHLHPLLVAGGAAVISNPEALSDIFDLILPCEAEIVLPPVIESLLNQTSIADLDKIPGVMLAGMKKPAIELKHRYDINIQPAYTHIVSSENAFGGAHLIEVMRGCPRNCQFCLAREIYQPARALSLDNFINFLDKHPDCSDLGLVAPSLFDHPQIADIFAILDERKIRIRNSSIKWEKLQPQLLYALRRSGITGLTIAPETGSEKLRAAIKKPMDTDLFMLRMNEIFTLGFERLKMYFIACLPGEDNEDIEATVELIRKVVENSPQSAEISAAFSIFVPKKHTAWADKSVTSLYEMKQKIKFLKGKLTKISSRLRFSISSPQEAIRQAYLSKVGSELSLEYDMEAKACRKDRLFSRKQFSAMEF